MLCVGVGVSCQPAYFPLVLMVTLFKAAFTSQVTWDMTAPRMLPKFALMAFLDSLEDLAVVVGTAHTTVALQTLLPQVQSACWESATVGVEA